MRCLWKTRRGTQMKSVFSSWILTALLFSTFVAPVRAQEQAVKKTLAGQRLLLTYREGGALYGTYYFLDVHFCASGSYMTFGQSRKTTVLDNTRSALSASGAAGTSAVSTDGPSCGPNRHRGKSGHFRLHCMPTARSG